MAKQGSVIIIKKKKGAHGHGHHGGAWKVAYADFVTAMMAFFLVMWLMGSDEETKAAIANYFNNPSSPTSWRPEMNNKDSVPLGKMTGSGDDVLKGDEGEVPEDLIQRPSQVLDRPPGAEGKIQSEGLLSGEEILAATVLKFEIPESQLFKGDTSELDPVKSKAALRPIEAIARKYKGKLLLHTTYDSHGNRFESENSRIDTLRQHLVDRRLAADDNITVSVKPATGEGTDRQSIEITFTK